MIWKSAFFSTTHWPVETQRAELSCQPRVTSSDSDQHFLQANHGRNTLKRVPWHIDSLNIKQSFKKTSPTQYFFLTDCCITLWKPPSSINHHPPQLYLRHRQCHTNRKHSATGQGAARLASQEPFLKPSVVKHGPHQLRGTSLRCGQISTQIKPAGCRFADITWPFADVHSNNLRSCEAVKRGCCKVGW